MLCVDAASLLATNARVEGVQCARRMHNIGKWGSFLGRMCVYVCMWVWDAIYRY